MKAEASLAFLAYNMKRAINILGVKEIIRRLTAKRVSLTSSFPKYTMKFGNIILYVA
ncbi:MAG: hypothetical protein GX023_08610 [Tissierellia bacterium]|nr:hypothetical protein [Tissierellia bacterium]